MWSIRIAIGGAVLAFAALSAVAQTARTSPAGTPLSLLDINQRPSVEQPATHVDQPARSTPAKPRKTVVAARSQPAPTHTAPVAHAAGPWPAAYADAPDPMAAFPLAPPPASASAKLRAKPARNGLVGDDVQVVRLKEINSPDLAADRQNEAAHLMAPSAVEQPQRVTAAMLPGSAPPSSLPAMVATPASQNDSPVWAASWMAQALGGVLGLLGGGVGWFLIGSTRKRGEMSPEPQSGRPNGYNWASAYYDRWDQ